MVGEKLSPGRCHDENDYKIGIKHKLEKIDIFNDNGTLNKNTELFIGEDRFVARKKITKQLQAEGHIVKIEDYVNKVGFSERTNEVIEPKLSMQWFLKMTEMAKPALEVVMNDTIQFHPSRFKNVYKHWMENVHDWCISRQLWWGQRIPVYYLPDGSEVVAKSKEEALEIAKKNHDFPELKLEDLRQDEDVVDTWFSSWLWPISTFDGIRKPDNPDINYYYPTSVLVTAPDIIFFWVARMIMAGLEYRNEIPFKHVYLTGVVRDKHGRKMSKSLGNSPDPIELMQKYGADGVRLGMLLTSPAGNDLPFDPLLCEQGRNFSNKFWNALRLVKGWEIDEKLEQPQSAKISIEWFDEKFNETLKTIDDYYSKYRISDVLMTIYRLIWDDFCSWYLEMIKPQYTKPIDKITYEKTIDIFEKLMQVLHPFMPFITEEIWHLLKEKTEDESIMVSNMPLPKTYNKKLIKHFDIEQEVINAVRNVRKEKNIPNKEQIKLFVKKNLDEKADNTFDSVIKKLCNLTELEYAEEKPEGAISFMVKSTEFYIPLTESLDIETEIKKLENELEYAKGFLNSVMKKLSNKKFVDNAPEKVVEFENMKKADAEGKIKVIEEQLHNLKK